MCTPDPPSAIIAPAIGKEPPPNDAKTAAARGPPRPGPPPSEASVARPRRGQPIQGSAIPMLPISKPVVPTIARARIKARTANSKLQRVPSNEYVPRGCIHCGMSFVPGTEGGQFCTGECEHTFAFLRHRMLRQHQQQQQQALNSKVRQQKK